MIRVGYVHSAPLLDPLTREAIQTLEVNHEVEQLRSVLKESRQRVCFRAEVATVANLSALLTRGVVVLHYSGHGLESGDLAFENEQGELHPLRVANLRELITGHTGVDIARLPANNSALLDLESAVASTRAHSDRTEKRRRTQVNSARSTNILHKPTIIPASVAWSMCYCAKDKGRTKILLIASEWHQ
jgi:hypothetical protein